MKERKCVYKKLNNCGMTLIEVLIAMTLLTIAIIPMLRAFVQVNRYGDMGRNLQQTTTIAQTAMENCKAYNVSDIQNKMAEAKFLKGDYLADAVWSYNEANGTYYIDNMNVDNRKVGMAVKLEPIGTTTEAITKYQDCNERLDAVFVESLAEYSLDSTKGFQEVAYEKYDELFQKIADKVNANAEMISLGITVTKEEVKDSYFSPTGANKGKITIVRNVNIVANQTGGFDQATVEYNYAISAIAEDYHYVVSPVKTVDISISSLVGTNLSSWALIYKNNDMKDQGGKLERIYFYYYPAYSDPLYADYPCASDNILVSVNGLGRNVDVYLVKQKYPDKQDTSISLGESTAYKKNVKVVTDNHVRLYHNYGVNIGKTPNPSDPSGHLLTWPGMGELDKDDDKCEDMNGLVEQENKVLMYQIQVDMYANPEMESGVMTGEEILSLDGTKINW